MNDVRSQSRDSFCKFLFLNLTFLTMKDMRSLITDKQRIREIVAVFVTAAGKFIFMDWLQWKLLFILTAIIAWTVYVMYKKKRIKGILQYWGFRTDNFREVLKMVLPFGIIAVVTFFIVGFYRDTINLMWHIVPILILYPVWGVVQQFLVIALVAGNLKDLKGYTLPDALILFTTALLFGLLHYPFYWLIAGTFVLALFYGVVYLRARNIFVMGIFHGWLGGLFFYTVVGRDPFAEVFAKLASAIPHPTFCICSMIFHPSGVIPMISVTTPSVL